jgi:hypothetical protein
MLRGWICRVTRPFAFCSSLTPGHVKDWATTSSDLCLGAKHAELTSEAHARLRRAATATLARLNNDVKRQTCRNGSIFIAPRSSHTQGVSAFLEREPSVGQSVQDAGHILDVGYDRTNPRHRDRGCADRVVRTTQVATLVASAARPGECVTERGSAARKWPRGARQTICAR